MNIQLHEYKIPLSEMTDGELIKLVLAGEHTAFEPLVSRYQRPLLNFICHFLGNYDVACDILQDVFVKLYIAIPTLRTHEPLKPWLFQVARNSCLDELRRKRAIAFSQLEVTDGEDDLSPMAILPDTDPLPEEVAELHELQFVLRQAIDELPLKFRQVVLLRYIGRFSFVEISTILNMPQATAKTYFQRARPLLRKTLSSSGQYQKMTA
jgi:RNA polymerase sigma factor (sigma-70 family)